MRNKKKRAGKEFQKILILNRLSSGVRIPVYQQVQLQVINNRALTSRNSKLMMLKLPAPPEAMSKVSCYKSVLQLVPTSIVGLDTHTLHTHKGISLARL